MKIITKILLVGLVVMIGGCSEENRSGTTKTHSSHYQEAPTYEQWQNIEAFNCFMMVLGELINGYGFSGDSRFSDPYGNQKRPLYGGYDYYEPWMR